MKKIIILAMICSLFLSINVSASSSNVYYNNKNIALDTKIVNDYSYVSLRQMASLFDMDISYDEKTGDIYLEDKLEYTPLIAHAGGQAAGIDGTNSKEGIINSVIKGQNLVEIDFGFTTDGKLVAIHDFEDGLSKYFKKNYEPITHEQFMNLELVNNLTQIDLEGIIYLLDIYPELRIITDTKYDNVEMLSYIANSYPNHINRFIPQIYTFSEYKTVSNLGYKNIIYTTYMNYISNKDLLYFAKNNDLFAVTMPYESALTGLAKGIYDNTGTKVYAHTVNDVETYNKLKAVGVYGVYTDTLNFADIEQ